MATTNALGDADESWLQEAAAALAAHDGLLQRIGPLIPAGYDELNGPELAAIDFPIVARTADGGPDLDSVLVRTGDGTSAEWRFRVFHRGSPIALSDLLPLLDQLGMRSLDERSFRFELPAAGGAAVVHLHDVGVVLPASAGDGSDAGRLDEARRAFERQYRGEIDTDGFNRLVLAAGLSTRDVEVVRAYARYLRQTSFPFSQQYVEAALIRHAPITSAIVRLFHLRFDPAVAGRDPGAEAEARAMLGELLDAVPSLDDDRTLRTVIALVDATVRTNVHRPADGGGHRPVMAFKLDPSKVPDLPLPRPMFEIWVSSPRVEGVHLRGGRIARGGIRWSDRPEDFRTEVLGLVKAQMVKNAVIVPTGAKGGFVVKRPAATPEQQRAEGVECYRAFIGGLLDLTDDLVDGVVVPPPHTVRHDGDDPYLVVAADKGTASFSDIANEVAASYGFWLGDAFASGGSAGYDHKAMGITARGAWESVRRHARAIGRDADSDPLTVVGIGDMSGDVFGNGLLRSPHVRLVAAFDHRHVFLDPAPDPVVAYAERARLFRLPRSSWADYDPELISAGGGVHQRSAKRIELSPQVRAALGTDLEGCTPNELIGVILRAPADVLWNGGIGTYVKASTETHAEVGDRANDAVRVDGAQLRCRLVAEGGNLGLTQRARIEYALAGGLVYSDAIDNSAGVDCSDHEVNIKILLRDVVASTGMTVAERDDLLRSMTDEVAEQVLDDNRAQTLVLGIARRQSLPMVNVHARYLNQLESEGWLNRALEFLPTDKQLAERQALGRGLTAPEFAVLLAYTKTTNIELVVESTLPDDPYLLPELQRYFPRVLRERFPEQVARHPLRREIIATQVGNQMVNISGISFDHRLTEDTGVGVVDITRAWIAARDVLGVVDAWEEIDSLGSSVKLDVQFDLFLDARRALERVVSWILRHRRPPIDIGRVVQELRTGMDAMTDLLDGALRGRMRDLAFAREAARLTAGVPERLAQRSALWPVLHTGLDVVELAARDQVELDRAVGTYWQVFDAIDGTWLWESIGALPRSDRWQTQARAALRDDLLAVLADLTAAALQLGSVHSWIAANDRAVARAAAMFTELRRADKQDITTLSVAVRNLRNLSMTTRRTGT